MCLLVCCHSAVQLCDVLTAHWPWFSTALQQATLSLSPPPVKYEQQNTRQEEASYCQLAKQCIFVTLFISHSGFKCIPSSFFTRSDECIDVIYSQLCSFPSALSPLGCLLHFHVDLFGDRKGGLIIGKVPLLTSSTCIVGVFNCVCSRVCGKRL